MIKIYENLDGQWVLIVNGDYIYENKDLGVVLDYLKAHYKELV